MDRAHDAGRGRGRRGRRSNDAARAGDLFLNGRADDFDDFAIVFHDGLQCVSESDCCAPRNFFFGAHHRRRPV